MCQFRWNISPGHPWRISKQENLSLKPRKSVCENETNDASFYDNNGSYDKEKHGPVIHHLDKIQNQKIDERHFAAVIQSWFRPLLFGDQKEQIDKNYLDLSTIHYPHHKKYLDFMALQEGSVDRQSSLAYKEVVILISLVIEYFRTGLHKLDFESFFLKK